MFSVSEIIDIAIRLEKNGEAVYRSETRKIESPELASLLEWIADEEVKHAKWFMALKHKSESSDEKIFAEEISGQLLKELMGGKTFSLDTVNFSKVKDRKTLIDIFIEFEQDSILFYEMLQPFIEQKNTRRILGEIIAEEYTHVARLREVRAAPDREPSG